MLNRVLKTAFLSLMFICAGRVAAFADASFSTQPGSKDLGHISAPTSISINYSDGTLAKLTASESCTLEYYYNNAWTNTGISLSVNASGVITAPALMSNSQILNHNLRIKTQNGVYSKVFFIAVNTSSAMLPTPLGGMSAARQYAYTAGDTVSLVPDVETAITLYRVEIDWQRSTDAGESWENVITVNSDVTESLVATVSADCSMTGYLYRYAIVDPEHRTYTWSDPIELVVYESFAVSGTKLTITSAGDANVMNHYEGRMDGLQPWASYAASITEVDFGSSVRDSGSYAFRGFTRLSSINYRSLTVIGKGTFKNNTALISLTFPVQITSIEREAFSGCTGLKDITVLNPQTVIDLDASTFPQNIPAAVLPNASSVNQSIAAGMHEYPVIYGYKGKAYDADNAIEASVPGSSAYDYAMTNNRAFFQIGAIAADGVERRLLWDYEIDAGGNIIKIKIRETAKVYLQYSDLQISIPKSLDGHPVTVLCGTERDGQLYDLFGISTEAEKQLQFEQLLIPDTVTQISNSAFSSIQTVRRLYNFSKSDVDMQTTLYNDTQIQSAAECYTYSTNHTFRVYTEGFSYKILDVDSMTGSTGDLVYTLNVDTGSLTLTGTGASADYTSALSQPFAWAFEEITTITIGNNVRKLGNYIFAGLRNVTTITNQASDLNTVSATAFQNVGSANAKDGKRVTTCVNLPLYNVITALNTSLTANAKLSLTVTSKRVRLSSKSSELAKLNARRREAQRAGQTSTVASLDLQIAALTAEIAHRRADLTEAETSSAAISTIIADRRTKLSSAAATSDALKAQLATETDPATIASLAASLETSLANEEYYKKEIEELQETLQTVPFTFSYSDTRQQIGTGIYFVYDTSTLTLTIDGDGIIAPITAPDNAPWAPVSNYIRKVVINSNVVSLSNNMFHNMPNLRTVWNYGQNQTFVNGSDSVFDVIGRVNSAGDGTDIVTLVIPERNGDTPVDREVQYESILAQAKKLNVHLSEAALKGMTLTCTQPEHTHTADCYEDGKRICAFANEHTHSLSACYTQGAVPDIQGGSFTFERTETESGIMSVITGTTPSFTELPYIVPVYTFGNTATAFNACVPSEANGYRLMDIFLSKGACGEDLTYYISLDGVLLIEGSGAMYNFTAGNAPWHGKASSIRTVSLPSGLTSIGDYAFEDCELLTEISVPAAVRTIGTCAYKGCTNLYSYTIGSGIVDIGGGAFAECTSLRIVDCSANTHFGIQNGMLIKDSVRLLSFLRESLYQDTAAKTLYAQANDLQIPNGIQSVASFAFYKNDSFFNLYLPESLTKIENNAFYMLSNLRQIDSVCKVNMTVGTTAFTNCGGSFTSGKQAVIYKANKNLDTAAVAAGYPVSYHDSLNVDHISAVYTGGKVTLNRAFNKSDVLITIFYESGETVSTDGTDGKISFSSLLVKDPVSTFAAIYDDGLGTRKTSNTFTIEGQNGITDVTFTYSGSNVWLNDSFDREKVVAKVTYADGTTTIVKGDAQFNISAGSKQNYIEFESMVVTKVGDNAITCTYNDRGEKTYTGKMNVRGQNYVVSMTAEYTGEPVEVSAGVGGLDYEAVRVMLNYVNGNTATVTGYDSRINISPDVTRVGDKLLFEYSLFEDDKNKLVGSFAVPYTTNLVGVDFLYSGAPVTENMTFSWSGVELTLHMADNSTQTVTGDKVNGLSANTMIIDGAGYNKEIDVTYEVGTQVFSGTIQVPCVIRKPVKLKITQRPRKSVYQNGDYFDSTGMIVTCLFDNGSTEDVTEAVSIDGGNVMTDSQTFIKLNYFDTSSAMTVSTNLSVNVNQYQKQEQMTKQFREQYAITRILFRSKKTADDSLAYTEEELADCITDADGHTGIDANGDGTIDAEEMVGVWQDVTPNPGAGVFTGSIAPMIKAGYGFEVKVTTNYKTNRGGTEFNAFLLKAQWDTRFETDYPSVASEIRNKWAYLNDVYPQVAETANPDVLYLRVINTNSIGADNVNTSLDVIGDRDSDRGFIVLEKTNEDENGNILSEGEWYDSTKIFEIPMRDPFNSGVDNRRVYVSAGAADIESEDTYYTIQIISPAFYGYEAEPVLVGDKFVYSTDPDSTEGVKTWSNGERNLIVCAAFTIDVKNNDDVHTHIVN